MSKLVLSLLFAGVVGLATAPLANAQPIIRVEYSIEFLSANSDSVAIARLVDFKKSDPGNLQQFELTMDVEQTLKGHHASSFHMKSHEIQSKLEEWKREARSLLVFRNADNESASRYVVDLDDDGLTMLTKGFKRLSRPDQVLRAVQESVEAMPGILRVQSFNLEIPAEVVKTDWLNDQGALLTVPVDIDLEKIAREYCTSERYSVRCKGARALRYFRSPENIKLAKALLDDPGWSYLKRADENQGVEVLYFGVRAGAFDTLRYWGIDAYEPQVREEVTRMPDNNALDRSR